MAARAKAPMNPEGVEGVEGVEAVEDVEARAFPIIRRWEGGEDVSRSA